VESNPSLHQCWQLQAIISYFISFFHIKISEHFTKHSRVPVVTPQSQVTNHNAKSLFFPPEQDGEAKPTAEPRRAVTPSPCIGTLNCSGAGLGAALHPTATNLPRAARGLKGSPSLINTSYGLQRKKIRHAGLETCRIV